MRFHWNISISINLTLNWYKKIIVIFYLAIPAPVISVFDKYFIGTISFSTSFSVAVIKFGSSCFGISKI